MQRKVLAALLILHGLAHASIGVWASAGGLLWLTIVLWTVALVGYLLAGVGVLGFPVAQVHWRQLLIVATVASMLLLLRFLPLVGLLGIVVDVALLGTALELTRSENRVQAHPGHVVRTPRLAWGGRMVAGVLLVYIAGVMLFRPVYLHWGSTAQERGMHLSGDDFVPSALYRVDHAITVAAPARMIWPWLVQIGQDRGGFYSYAWLERLVGDRVTNSDRIRPQWQQRSVGDTVYATQPGYLGLSRRFGWRITALDPGRAIVLEGWGAMVLVPVDDTTTRLIIRTRGEGVPSISGILLGPLGVFIFEPAHFIMQRGMMRGIRSRAEREAAARKAACPESP